MSYYAICDRCELKGIRHVMEHASPIVVIMKIRYHLEKEHQLECYFCFHKFAGFKELAEHVNDAHVTPKLEQEQSDAWDSLFNYPIGENDMALPTPGGGKRDAERGNSGGRGNARKPPQVPFVRVEDLREEPSRAKILAVVTQNTGFNDVIVKITINGKSYFLGLKASNPNYEALFNAFGDNENKWVGEEFMIGLNWNDFYEKNFIHIFECPAPKSRGKKE